MHPKSKDRKGNAKVLADARKDRKDAKAGNIGPRFRRSKYGARLEALRAKKLGLGADDAEELAAQDEEEG